jgi:hypothetical protein
MNSTLTPILVRFRFFDSCCLLCAGYELFTLWGRPYGIADWGRKDVSWYFIAAATNSDESVFVRDGLSSLLQVYAARPAP